MSCIRDALCPWVHFSRSYPKPARVSGIYSADRLDQMQTQLLRGKELYAYCEKMVEEALFMPDGGRKRLSLVFLATFAAANNRSPFTERQQELFEVSEKSDRVAARCLCVGCCITVSSSAVVCVAAAVGNAPLVITAAVASAVSATFGYFSTGVYPDRASAKANDRQDTFAEVVRSYLDLSGALISLSIDDRDFAREVANNLPIDKIEEAMSKHLSVEKTQEVIEPLLNAHKFVLHGQRISGPLPLINYAAIAIINGFVPLEQEEEEAEGAIFE